mmetsp:Transcript_7018/g.10266  ORF Transcript_7018/g.10266 Transcript_7018/m.10266 type:complete len:99 (-) Transcript_7018:1388-1684(-)
MSVGWILFEFNSIGVEGKKIFPIRLFHQGYSQILKIHAMIQLWRKCLLPIFAYHSTVTFALSRTSRNAALLFAEGNKSSTSLALSSYDLKVDGIEFGL